MLHFVIQRLKKSSFYEAFRRLKEVYGVLDRRGRQVILLSQINQVVTMLIGTVGLVAVAGFIIVLSKPEVITGNRYIGMVYEATGLDQNYFLILLSGVLVLAMILHQIFLLFSSFIQVRLTQGVVRRCTVMMYRYYLAEGYENHIKRGVSNIIGKSLMAAGNVVSSEMSKTANFIANFVNIFAIVVGLFVLKPEVGLVLLFVILSAYITFFSMYKHRARRLGGQVFHHQMKQVRLIRDGSGGASEIKLMGKESDFAEEVNKSLATALEKRLQIITLNNIPQKFIRISTIITLYLVMVYLLLNSSPERIFVTLALFSAAIFRLLPSLQAVFDMLIAQAKSTEMYESVIEDLKLASRLVNSGEDSGPSRLIVVKDQIHFDNVTYSYPETSEPVIKNLSFSLPANKTIALFGRSGTGKTTIIRLLSGLLSPQEGRVLVDGKSLQHDTTLMQNWQRSIGIVFQKPFFMNATVAMNVAFVATEDKIDYERVREVIKLAQLEDLVEGLPQGLDTAVEEDSEILSGGQRQRLAIARALYRNVSILILDEATNSLDLVVEKKIINSLMQIRENKVVIIIAHRPETMRFADMVLVMKEDGSLARGTYDELFNQDPDFRALIGSPEQMATA